MSTDGQGTLWRRNIAENFNRLSRAHERYRQTTDGRTMTYSERELEFTFAKNVKNVLHVYALVSCCMCSVTADVGRWVLECLRRSCVCRDYDFTQDWTLDEAQYVVNPVLDASYQ